MHRVASSTTYADWKTDPLTTAIPTWNTAGRIYNDGNGYYRRTGYTTFDYKYIIGWNGFDSALPIELLSFDAQLVNDEVELKWVTATEINNDYFTIERSTDAVKFVPIANQDGAGNSNQLVDYEDIDATPLMDWSYYRLKQTDFNGSFSYSNIVPVFIDRLAGGISMLNLFPNPSTGEQIHLELSGFSKGEKVWITLKDAIGKVCFSEVMVTNARGYLVRELLLSKKLNPGTYLVNGLSNDKIYHNKLIIQ
jgi:hypothetical protein